MDTTAMISSLNLTVSRLAPLVAKLLLGLVLLVLGWLVAKGLGWVTTWVLKNLRLDKGAKTVGFNTLLEKADIKKTISELLGDLVYWAAMFKVVVWVLTLLKLPVWSVLDKIIAFTGTVFLAAFVLGVGLFLASLIAGIVRFFLANFGVEGAKTASRFIYYVITTYAVLAVFAVFGIPNEVFSAQINVIIGAVGLAAAIAFGLGCKDMAADFLHNLFKGR